MLSAKLMNIDIEFIDGVLGKDVLEKTIPQTKEWIDAHFPAKIGCWRSHMNVMQEYVTRHML
jgi:GR25 family glycosyltransferase involved in LPS biosynthesis